MKNAPRNASLVRPRAADWVGMFGAPLLWLTELNVAYWIVPVTCEARQALPVTAVSISFLVLTTAVGVTAWRNWQRAGRSWPSSTADDVPFERSRFMAVIGLMATGLFGLFILADILPTLIIHPCLE